MLYHPREKGMWDTWMFHHEGIFHLYYLQTVDDVGWKQIGHATSPDLLRWKEEEPAIYAGREGQWDEPPLGTGMVLRHNGKFYMTYCCLRAGKPQRTGLAVSDDLYAWTKQPDNPIMEPAMGFGIYESNPSEVFDNSPSWRDAYVRYDEDDGTFHALLAARLPSGSYVRRGCVGHAVSTNLVNWQALPPIYAPGKLHDYEVPELHKIGDKYYLFWTALALYTNHYEIPSRTGPTGEFYAISKKPYEDFCEPIDNLLVGSGNNRFDNCSVRIWQLDNEHMLHYQMVGGPLVDLVSLSAPKVLRISSDGQLSAGYCNRCDALKKRGIASGFDSKWLRLKRFLEGERWFMEGETLVAEVDGSYVLPTDISMGNFLLECEVMIENGFFAGLGVLETSKRPNAISAGVALDGKSLKVHVLGDSSGKTGPVLKPLDSSGFLLQSNHFHHLRIMVRQPWTDVFLDDRLYFSLALPWPKEGRLVFFACDGRARFKNIKAHEI